MRVQDGNLVLDDVMEILSQNVSIAGDLDITIGYRPVGTNRYQLLVRVIYVNKKQEKGTVYCPPSTNCFNASQGCAPAFLSVLSSAHAAGEALSGA